MKYQEIEPPVKALLQVFEIAAHHYDPNDPKEATYLDQLGLVTILLESAKRWRAWNDECRT